MTRAPRRKDDEYQEGSSGSEADEPMSDDADFRPAAAKKPSKRGTTVQAADATTDKTNQPKQKASQTKRGASGTKDKGYAWEATYKRSWDVVREDEGGSLAGAVRGLLEATKRRRFVIIFTLRDLADGSVKGRCMTLLLCSVESFDI